MFLVRKEKGLEEGSVQGFICPDLMIFIFCFSSSVSQTGLPWSYHIIVLGIIYQLWRNTFQLFLTQFSFSGKSLYLVCPDSYRARLWEALCLLIPICKCALWGGLPQGLLSLWLCWSWSPQTAVGVGKRSAIFRWMLLRKPPPTSGKSYALWLYL